MNKLMISVAGLMTALFPKSERAISDNLITEQFNAFGEELTEVGNRINSQTDGNEKLVADLKLANEANVAHAAKIVELNASVSDLTTKLSAAETERTIYKAWFDKSANAGNKYQSADLAMNGSKAVDFTEMAYLEAQGKS